MGGGGAFEVGVVGLELGLALGLELADEEVVLLLLLLPLPQLPIKRWNPFSFSFSFDESDFAFSFNDADDFLLTNNDSAPSLPFPLSLLLPLTSKDMDRFFTNLPLDFFLVKVPEGTARSSFPPGLTAPTLLEEAFLGL